MDFDFEGTDRFEVLSRLGEGAMGVVYQAVDREKNEPIAIKTLRNLDGEGLLRFKNEFRAIQSLQHLNLISLGELIETAGRWFFTMELIEGTDFYSWVRPHRRFKEAAGPVSDDFTSATANTHPAWVGNLGPAPGFDEDRLRSALTQLAQGVATLHRAGLVHRDIKPSNVLVSREGRVVLLDFGFVAPRDDRSSDRIVGTAAYMSPEQAASQAVAPESDWYSVGVMLYEALTGRPPIDGAPIEVLMAKQHRVPLAPSELVAGLPIDLEELCMALLRIRPAERPTEAEILRRLGAEAGPVSSSLSMDLSRPPFVGRAEQLEELKAAFREYRSGKTVSVFIHGESGIGKSALVREFTSQLADESPDTLVLASSCYERESVPYKAFDGVIDALSRHLSMQSEVDAAMVVPLHVAPVAHVFPVLRRSEVFTRAVRPLPAGLEPAELRARLFAGLREMFTRLATKQPVVVVIDDFQWADADSLALLRELFRQPNAPPLMLVSTVRSGSERRAPGTGGPQLATDHVCNIHLRGLERADARILAAKLAEYVAPGIAGVVDSILGDSEGHPLYIDEMLRHCATSLAPPSTSLQLETVLWHRVIGLEPEAKEVLEYVALSTGPLEAGIAAAAARLTFADLSRWVSVLRVGKLVHTTGARRADRIEIFHDRVRQAVVQHMTPATSRHCHERLALAIEGSGANLPEALAIHWAGAGDRERAYQYTYAAAQQASQALAFERAARLYRRCIELLPAGAPQLPEILTLIGDALVNAGLGSEGANAYLSAAEASIDNKVELYALAAGQLLRAGHVDSGLEVLRRSLAPLGLRLPATPLSATISLGLQRLGIRMRGLRFREQNISEIPRRDLTRVDVSWSLAAGFGLTDVVRGAEFQARHLRMALKTGDPNRIGRALALEVGYRFTAGTRGGDDAHQALARAQALATRLGDPPSLVGQNTLMAGIGAVLEGRWAAAEELCARAEEILRDKCSGVGWELSSSRIMHLWALWYLGKVDAISERLPRILRESQDRGDLYAATSYRVFFAPMVHLVEDQPHLAHEVASHSLDRWSQQGFHFQHYCRLFADTQVLLYAGEHANALEVLQASWPNLRSSLLLSIQQNLVEALHFRGRAELAVGRMRGDEKLLKLAHQRAKAIAREKSIWGDGLAHLLEAGIADTRGKAEIAIEHLTVATELLDQRGMELFATAARRTLGGLRGGPEGDAMIAAADATMTARGIKNPARMTSMLVAGFDSPALPSLDAHHQRALAADP